MYNTHVFISTLEQNHNRMLKHGKRTTVARDRDSLPQKLQTLLHGMGGFPCRLTRRAAAAAITKSLLSRPTHISMLCSERLHAANLSTIGRAPPHVPSAASACMTSECRCGRVACAAVRRTAGLS
jgi:hypothetical protein